MSKTRNNHYVPQWYQEGFFELGRNALRYLDMQPPQRVLPNGRVITENSKFDAPTSRAFRERDLYSTFFGTSVNDEIERRLFGSIDTNGSAAVRAFLGDDVGEWHDHFQTLFEFIDIQKIRTPKGLDWLKAQYPSLTQNELMFEMQGIRLMHCTIWTEGVREIVSAQDANVKFIISDHPVTIYNHAVRPEAASCDYPNDPGIALKASQTIFPLNRDFCLILTNLEYAKDPSCQPLVKRTFARNFGQSMVRTDAFIRSRRLSDLEVTRINYILKARARRYIAAGKDEWLYPEKTISDRWADLRETLLPKDDLWRFGGELYASFDDGHVRYQDPFGRTEKQREFLLKTPPAKPLRPGDGCGCGSGKRFKDCCKPRTVALRPTWAERSIRERNMALCRAVTDILELDKGKSWTAIRRDLTDEQISEIYHLYEGLWPIETDILQLLPKPDGCSRAIYTGLIHPHTISEFALGSSLYFGELLIESPFLHAGTVRKEFSPVTNPRAYRQEFLKTIIIFLSVMPLVELGLVDLIPDPCNFDTHLRDQMMRMASARSAGLDADLQKDLRLKELMEQDSRRILMSLSPASLRAQVRKSSPELDEAGLEEVARGIEQLREQDPLAVLQQGSFDGGKDGGLFSVMKLVPNFEMAMYLAQATGACIVTDSVFRWNEIRRAIRPTAGGSDFGLPALAKAIATSEFLFPSTAQEIVALSSNGKFATYPALMREASKYLANLPDRGLKPNFEAHLASRFMKAHEPAQASVRKVGIATNLGRISCAFPVGGIQDNTVNRLLLMSSSEAHLANVPMAFFIERKG